MKRLSLIAICLLPLLLANFSSQQTDTGKDGHTINFYGTVVTTSDNQPIKIENITLSGRTENIFLYIKPASKDIDPQKNKTELNLRDIKAIIPKITGKSPVAYTFNNRDYIEVTVIWKKKKKDTYLIERDLELYGKESNEAKPKRIIALEGIRRLDIAGFNYQDTKSGQPSQTEKDKIKELLTSLNTNINEIKPDTLKENISKKVQELTEILESIIE